MIRTITRCVALIAIALLMLPINTFSAFAHPIPDQIAGLTEAARAALGPNFHSLLLPNTQQAKLLASDKATDDHFGNAAALSGNGSTALVGASAEDDSGLTNNGAVYVFVRTGTT